MGLQKKKFYKETSKTLGKFKKMPQNSKSSDLEKKSV